MREALGRLVARLVRCCRQLLSPHLQPLGSIALGCCRDAHPGTLRAGHAVLRRLALDVLAPLTRAQGAKAVRPFTTGLIDALLPGLGHRHAAVRASALRALVELVPCGAAASIETLVGYTEPNVVPIASFYGKASARVNVLASLSQDKSRTVRATLQCVLFRWCRELPYEDLYSQEARLFVYLLAGARPTATATARPRRAAKRRPSVRPSARGRGRGRGRSRHSFAHTRPWRHPFAHTRPWRTRARSARGPGRASRGARV